MRRIIQTATRIAVALALCFLTNPVIAQIDTDAYFKYLEEHKGMTSAELLREYPAGMFRAAAPTDVGSVSYFADIEQKYNLTAYEQELTANHGFMVTERLTFPTYRTAYYDIYIKDLPVYISADAILHTVHRSYDNILFSLEEGMIIALLDSAIQRMRFQLRTSTYNDDALVQKAIRDADLYLYTGEMLLNGATSQSAQFVENVDRTMLILSKIEQLQMSSIALFGEVPRAYDFSQFKPRGHYTRSDAMKRYFQTMMWFGRTEIYITKPIGADPEPTDEDIRRQGMLAIILADVSKSSGADVFLADIDRVITKFVGEQDNLSYQELTGVMERLSITAPEQLNDDALWSTFQDNVVSSGGDQKILSQLLWGDPFSADQIKPAAAYMLMGQRFILDSYILGNVVFDKVQDRLMPSPLDAMFVLGNDAAIQLLTSELTTYDYALNLAGLRYLTNSLDDTYWSGSLYATWLSALRALNPPASRESLPSYMQTGAWWQKTLNTQLTSWAELRHDNLLYAKQSYTGGVGCFYPKGYVEPVPALYSTIAFFAVQFGGILEEIRSTTTDESMRQMLDRMQFTLQAIGSVNTQLSAMALKELRGETFTVQERELVDKWIIDESQGGGCILTYNGNFSRLMYAVGSQSDEDKTNFIVADIHTQPTDENGNMVGKVLHVGTGKINLAVVTAMDPSDNCTTAYIGPVGSYYETVTNDFVRLTDEDWVILYESQASRPLWVNNYLASGTGKDRGEQWNLLTGVDEQEENAYDISVVIAPNPTTSTAMIAFSVPPTLSGKNVGVTIVDARGELIATMMSAQLDAGNYLTSWSGVSNNGSTVATGSYYVRIQIGSAVTTKPVQLVR